MPKKFKITCEWIKKEMAAHKRAMARRYYIGHPITASGALDKKLVEYAALIGHKRGLLPDPATMALWHARGQCNMQPDQDGTGVVYFDEYEPLPQETYLWHCVPRKVIRTVEVHLRWLNWVPADPVEEQVAEVLPLAA